MTTLDDTFAALRQVLAAHSKRLIVTSDKPGDYQVGSPTMKDRIGRPLFVAAVQTRKNYVSYDPGGDRRIPRSQASLGPAGEASGQTVDAVSTAVGPHLQSNYRCS